MLRGRLPSGDLPQTSRNPSTPPPPPAESAMCLHPQIIERAGRKQFVVLPDEEFAASRPPSFPLFISAFSSARSLGVGGSAFRFSGFTPLLLFVSACQHFKISAFTLRCSAPCSRSPATSTPSHDPHPLPMNFSDTLLYNPMAALRMFSASSKLLTDRKVSMQEPAENGVALGHEIWDSDPAGLPRKTTI